MLWKVYVAAESVWTRLRAPEGYAGVTGLPAEWRGGGGGAGAGERGGLERVDRSAGVGARRRIFLLVRVERGRVGLAKGGLRRPVRGVMSSLW